MKFSALRILFVTPIFGFVASFGGCGPDAKQVTVKRQQGPDTGSETVAGNLPFTGP
jgi:hypothetical protein